MKNRFVCKLLTLCLLIGTSAVTNADLPEDLGPNLLNDPGFALPFNQTNWLRVHGAYISRDNRTEHVYEGTHSLYINIPEGQGPADDTVRIFQYVPVQGGERLYFRAWTKGGNVKSVGGQPASSSYYIEAYTTAVNADGGMDSDDYLGGVILLPNGGVKGTYGWTLVEGYYDVPEQAERLKVGAWNRHNGTTGEMWFDNMELYILPPYVLNALLRYPNYRGMTTPEDTTPWEIDARGTVSEEAGASMLTIELRSPSGVLLHKHKQLIEPGPYQVNVFWTPQDVELGSYVWDVKINGGHGDYSDQKSFTVTVQDEMPPVYVDSDGFAVRDGERFFPMGIYTGEGKNSAADLDNMVSAGFNTVLSYNFGDLKTVSQALDFLDMAHEKGLAVIYSVIKMYESRIGRNDGAYYPRPGKTTEAYRAEFFYGLREHPALLAWYTNDEYRAGYINDLIDMYEQICAQDPDHPVYQVITPSQTSAVYMPSLDIWGNDPYPVTQSALDAVSKRAANVIVGYSRRTKGIWQVVQHFDWSNARPDDTSDYRHPTLEEIRNMSYQNMVLGATGLIFYNYHQVGMHKDVVVPGLFETQWADTVSCIAELNRVVPYILENDVIDVEQVSISTQVPGAVCYRAWRKDGKLALSLANVTSNAVTIELRIPGQWIATEQSNDDFDYTVEGDLLTVELPGFGSGTIFFRISGTQFWLQ